jgi:hypothetical protein
MSISCTSQSSRANHRVMSGVPTLLTTRRRYGPSVHLQSKKSPTPRGAIAILNIENRPIHTASQSGIVSSGTAPPRTLAYAATPFPRRLSLSAHGSTKPSSSAQQRLHKADTCTEPVLVSPTRVTLVLAADHLHCRHTRCGSEGGYEVPAFARILCVNGVQQ